MKKYTKKRRITKRKIIKRKNTKKTIRRNNISNKKFKKYNKVRGGTNTDQVKCSMCEKMVPKKDTLVPNICLLQHGQRAHRICQDCWWDPKSGFALETNLHRCPGCTKGLPLLPKETPIIDLTD